MSLDFQGTVTSHDRWLSMSPDSPDPISLDVGGGLPTEDRDGVACNWLDGFAEDAPHLAVRRIRRSFDVDIGDGYEQGARSVAGDLNWVRWAWGARRLVAEIPELRC